jgi:shikimate kinase
LHQVVSGESASSESPVQWRMKSGAKVLTIALIGFRGAGKSTVARCLADRLGWEAVDADDVLQLRAGMSIQRVFAERGEPWFRRLEGEILAELVQRPQAVLALGGGVILSEANRRRLANLPVFWLDAPADSLFQRIEGDVTTRDRRPQLTSSGGLEEVRRLLADRLPLYQQTANHRLDVRDKNPRQVADEIIELLKGESSHAST